ncbi:MAG: hypothetical protein ACK41D_00620 [Rubricoccaceae bacterium]
MSVFLDHLTAILVGATLLGVVVFVQQRQQQQVIDSTVRYRVEHATAAFMETLQRDVENMRAEAQARHGLGFFQVELVQSAGLTRRFSFPTLAEPERGRASPLVMVSYVVQPTGRTARVQGTERPLFRVTRYAHVGGRYVRTGGAEEVTEFAVRAITADGASHVAGALTSAPVHVALSVATASPTSTRRSHDQVHNGPMNLTRHRQTVRVVSALATGLPPTPAVPAISPPALPSPDSPSP